MELFPSHHESLPTLTTNQMIEVDRSMVEDYHINLVQMMENAGRALAHLARRRFLADDPTGRRIVVLAGSGGNGGGALTAARRLHNFGARVMVVLARPSDKLTQVPAHQLDILRRMQVPVLQAEEVAELRSPDLILDGIIGYRLKGAPRGAAADMIRWANGQAAPILALDVPSGLDATTGDIFDPAIRAAATLTLALPKTGLAEPGVKTVVGELYLADIGVPPELYTGLGLTIGPIFAQCDILRLE